MLYPDFAFFSVLQSHKQHNVETEVSILLSPCLLNFNALQTTFALKNILLWGTDFYCIMTKQHPFAVELAAVPQRNYNGNQGSLRNVLFSVLGLSCGCRRPELIPPLPTGKKSHICCWAADHRPLWYHNCSVMATSDNLGLLCFEVLPTRERQNTGV